MRHVLCLLFVLSLATPAFSQDFRREIMEHVINACYYEKARHSKMLQYMTLEQSVELMKIIGKRSIDDTINTLVPMVSKLNYAQRMKLYRIGANICIRGGR